MNDQPHFITCGEIFYISAHDHHEFGPVHDLRLVNILYCRDRLSIRSAELRRLLFLSDETCHWQIAEDTLGQLVPVIASLHQETGKPDLLSRAMAESLFLQIVVTLYRNRFFH